MARQHLTLAATALRGLGAVAASAIASATGRLSQSTVHAAAHLSRPIAATQLPAPALTPRQFRLAAILASAVLGLFAVAPSQAAAGFCWAYNGTVGISIGDVSCEAAPGDNFALVIGDGSSAKANGGTGNTALVIGDGSSAATANGSGNTTWVIGDNSAAGANTGDNNTAWVMGNESNAGTLNGSGNTTWVIGDDSNAGANTGNNNRSWVIGNGSNAGTLNGSDNTAWVFATDSNAEAMNGDRNFALAAGGGCTASAVGTDQFDICP